MKTKREIHLIDIPVGGRGGLIWDRLHDEREEICELMLRDSQTDSEPKIKTDRDPHDATTAYWHQEFLQARLRKIDEALDRLMSGSYGNCSKCGQGIEDSRLELDPAIAFCPDCWKEKQNQNLGVFWGHDSRHVFDSNRSISSSEVEIALETLRPFDTILIRTLKSDYRILLLDPKTGRALVEGGQYLVEPREAYLSGSQRNDALFISGSIVVGGRLDMWVGDRFLSTSRVQSIDVKHHDSAESTEAISEAVHRI